MVNIVHLYNRFLRWPMKAAGVRPELVQIEPGTTMNFWVPTRNPDPNPNPNPNRNLPLVLLHGFAANAIIAWQFQVLALARSYDVYAPDFIFFGDSVTDRAERSPEFQAECVVKGLRKLGVERCVLVGFSYGGMVGFRLAEMWPDFVAAMVVTAAPAALTESLSRGLLEEIGYKSWPEYLIPETVKGVRSMFQIASYKLPPLPDWFFKHYLEAMVIHRKERAELLQALVAADDFTITRYPQRMLFIWGKNDKVFDVQIAYKMKEKIGGKVRMDCIEKAGHIVAMERPCIYNKCLKNFLDSLLEEEVPKKTSPCVVTMKS